MHTARERIKLGCMALRLTQRELATGAGMSPQELSAIGAGRYKATALTVGRVSAALGCTPEWLIDGTGSPPAWYAAAPTEVAIDPEPQPAPQHPLSGALSAGPRIDPGDLIVIVLAEIRALRADNAALRADLAAMRAAIESQPGPADATLLAIQAQNEALQAEIKKLTAPTYRLTDDEMVFRTTPPALTPKLVPT